MTLRVVLEYDDVGRSWRQRHGSRHWLVGKQASQHSHIWRWKWGDEKIVVSDEDAEKEAEELAKKYQMDKEDFLNQFGGLEMVKYDLEVRKVIELLKELNK